MPQQRGFAALTPQERSAIARLGAKRLHEMGLAHKFDSKEATEAGMMGGKSTYRAHGKQHMQKIGKMGGRPTNKPLPANPPISQNHPISSEDAEISDILGDTEVQ